MSSLVPPACPAGASSVVPSSHVVIGTACSAVCCPLRSSVPHSAVCFSLMSSLVPQRVLQCSFEVVSASSSVLLSDGHWFLTACSQCAVL